MKFLRLHPSPKAKDYLLAFYFAFLGFALGGISLFIINPPRPWNLVNGVIVAWMFVMALFYALLGPYRKRDARTKRVAVA